MKPKIVCILPFAALLGTAHAATVFKLDFDNSSPAAPGNTQTGWEAFSETTDQNNKTVNYAGYTDLATGNIAITTTGVKFTRNYNNGAATAPDFPGTVLDRVYNDLILVNTVGQTIDISVAGLKAGTYQFTTYHLTQGNAGDAKSTFDLLVQDSDSPSFGQTVGNFTMGAGNASPAYTNPTIPIFNVKSNGTDPVILRIIMTTNAGGGQGAWVGINGLEIAAIPEPSSLALLGLGGVFLLRRRR